MNAPNCFGDLPACECRLVFKQLETKQDAAAPISVESHKEEKTV